MVTAQIYVKYSVLLIAVQILKQHLFKIENFLEDLENLDKVILF